MAGLPFRCAQTQLEAFNCMNSPPDRTPQQHCDLVRGVAGTSGFPAPRVSTWHGTSDFTVEVGNLTELVDQWTNVNGVDVVADATATIGAATRREYRNAQGQTRVESWTISNMSHGTPVDPRRGCGTAGAFVLDVQLCSSRFAGEFFGLIPTSSQDAGVVVDAGPGPVSDAGTPPDAGSAFDAGTAADAGSRPDAGVGRVSGVGSSRLPTSPTSARCERRHVAVLQRTSARSDRVMTSGPRPPQRRFARSRQGSSSVALVVAGQVAARRGAEQQVAPLAGEGPSPASSTPGSTTSMWWPCAPSRVRWRRPRARLAPGTTWACSATERRSVRSGRAPTNWEAARAALAVAPQGEKGRLVEEWPVEARRVETQPVEVQPEGGRAVVAVARTTVFRSWRFRWSRFDALGLHDGPPPLTERRPS